MGQSQKKMNTKLRTAIASLYKDTRNHVRKENLQLEKLVAEGLKKGRVLGPTLFNIEKKIIKKKK